MACFRNGMPNNGDLGQIAALIRIYSVCSGMSLRKGLVNIGKCYFLTAGSALTLYDFVPYTFEAFVDFFFR